MVILGVIPARGGSVRVKRKNAKLLGEKPLIVWTIEAAKQSKMLDYFLVSTNDEEIRKTSKIHDARVPFKRPEEISADVDTTLVLIHALRWYEKKKKQQVSHVVCLQPTSPFRTGEDIDQCIKIATADHSFETVLTVSRVTQFPEWMFEMKPFTHELVPYDPEVHLEGKTLVSQNLPTRWYPNGAVYVTRRDVLLSGRIYGRKITGFPMPRERSIDLEEEIDFYYASATIPMLQDTIPKTTWLLS